jgi:DNA-binding transcriptional ArsR family regulator
MTRPASSKLCQSVSDASLLLRLLGNPHRLAIVCYLMVGEKTVAELEADLGIHQPTLSQQLAELREASVIDATRQGKSFVYRVIDPKAAAVIAGLRRVYAGLDDVTGTQGATFAEIMFDG